MSALRQALDDLNTNSEQWEAYEHEGHCAVLGRVPRMLLARIR